MLCHTMFQLAKQNLRGVAEHCEPPQRSIHLLTRSIVYMCTCREKRLPPHRTLVWLCSRLCHPHACLFRKQWGMIPLTSPLHFALLSLSAHVCFLCLISWRWGGEPALSAWIMLPGTGRHGRCWGSRKPVAAAYRARRSCE